MVNSCILGQSPIILPGLFGGLWSMGHMGISIGCEPKSLTIYYNVAPLVISWFIAPLTIVCGEIVQLRKRHRLPKIVAGGQWEAQEFDQGDDFTILHIVPRVQNGGIYTSRRVVYRTRVFNVCSVRHWFHTTNHSGFASLSKFNFLKKYARTFHWICKKPQRHCLFFCAKCSSQFLQWAWRGFCGNCFPISTAKREHASKSCHWARLT